MKLMLEQVKINCEEQRRCLYLITDTQWKCIGSFNNKNVLKLEYNNTWHTPIHPIKEIFSNSNFFTYTELDIESFMADHFELFI